MKYINEHPFKVTLLLIFSFALFFIVTQRWQGERGDSWKYIVQTDGRGYYAYLPAIFIYNDLNFDFVLRNEAAVAGPGVASHLTLTGGERGNKYFIGVALLLMPFFLIAWLISWIIGMPLTGYNEVFYESVSIAALFYAIAGLIFFAKLLRLYNIKEKIIAWSLLLIVFATNLFYYIVYEPSMSHAYSFMIISAFLFFMKSFMSFGKRSHLLFSSILLALCVLIRPVNGIIILAVPFLAGNIISFKEFVTRLFNRRSKLFLPVLVFALIVSIQPVIFYLTFGEFFHWTYKNEGFYFNDPHFFDVLFSYRKGLFVYTPLMLLCILSGVRLFRKSIFAAASFFFFFIILTYILSSWIVWYYGGSFGLRAFIEYYSLFMIPFSIFMNEIRSRIVTWVKAILCIGTVGLNLIQTVQYNRGIIHYFEMDKEKYWNVFLKTDPKYRAVTYKLFVDKFDESLVMNKRVVKNDYEQNLNWGAENTLTAEEHYSGRQSSKINVKSAFTPGFEMSYKELKDQDISYVNITLMALVKQLGSECVLVISFEDRNGQIITYNSYPIGLYAKKINSWEAVTYGVHCPRSDNYESLRAYVWNPSSSPVYIDDFSVELYTLRKP